MLESIKRVCSKLGLAAFSESELAYIESKQILEDIIQVAAHNPALFMSTVSSYFNVEIENEFMRKCRQDKYLFLSKLNSEPMGMNNMPNVSLRCYNYYTLKEYSYFILATQIQKSEANQAQRILLQSNSDSQ